MIKIIASLVILFVAVNLVMTIYHSVNKKMREGLENMDKKKIFLEKQKNLNGVVLMKK